MLKKTHKIKKLSVLKQRIEKIQFNKTWKKQSTYNKSKCNEEIGSISSFRFISI